MSRSVHVLSAVLMGALSLAVAPAPTSAEPADRRTVTVTGEGRVSTVPDRATVNLGVEARAPTLDAARADVERRVTEVLGFVDELGIAERRVRSTGLSIRPEYDWDPERRERRFLGYYVSRRIVVELEELDRLGRLLEGAVDAGVNEVSEPTLTTSREDALRREAMAAAASDARANAMTLAGALDATLGAPRRLAFGALREPVPMRAMAAAEAAGPEATYRPGEIEIRATVTATFDLHVE